MKTLDEINGAVDFLRCHGAKRDADCGGWFSADGQDLGSEPIESAELLRRELFRRSFETDKVRTAITGIIGG